MATENVSIQDTDLNEDAADRRAALAAAVELSDGIIQRHNASFMITRIADELYDWLRARQSLQKTITITAGPIADPPEGAMT